jgi:hypothetical protein
MKAPTLRRGGQVGARCAPRDRHAAWAVGPWEAVGWIPNCTVSGENGSDGPDGHEALDLSPSFAPAISAVSTGKQVYVTTPLHISPNGRICAWQPSFSQSPRVKLFNIQPFPCRRPPRWQRGPRVRHSQLDAQTIGCRLICQSFSRLQASSAWLPCGEDVGGSVPGALVQNALDVPTKGTGLLWQRDRAAAGRRRRPHASPRVCGSDEHAEPRRRHGLQSGAQEWPTAMGQVPSARLRRGQEHAAAAGGHSLQPGAEVVVVRRGLPRPLLLDPSQSRQERARHLWSRPSSSG